LLLFGGAVQLAGEVEARGKEWWIPPPWPAPVRASRS